MKTCAMTGAATSVLGPVDLALRDDLTSALRLMAGTTAVQEGQMGAQTSLFIRGGNSNFNKVLIDGKPETVDHPLYFIRDGIVIIPKDTVVPHGTVI